ncbi:hypothetical protein SAMN02745206_01557 [Desulfacinum infernum DSM 9756]|jgi:exonuclease VII large subunit|uniref:DUF1640 domain-containing protein n=1 Tax=Desulfacinum infernum DSM 9756 TaxID=1121391 RepID=A0A1M4ZWI0_9BACT|nr:hypothetical protein [Desulfacinum infernum]SHF22314.1 hypothetical protein SAMN02745206_01557 [Desulfacinum infernum DSM 9756]
MVTTDVPGNQPLDEKMLAALRAVLQQDVERLVKEKIADFVRQNELRAKELSLMERIVRVEEELKALREIESGRFETMEKRFEALQREMTARFEASDKRFEAMDKRFESLQREMHARFEAVDKRFEAMEKRFEAMDKRFESLQREMHARFETVDKRFEAMDRRFASLQWTMGIGFSFLTVLMGLLKFWS